MNFFAIFSKIAETEFLHFLYPYWFLNNIGNLFTQRTLQRKSHFYIPFLGIVRPQSKFPHSWVCERFIYAQDRSTYFPQQNRQIDRGIYKSLTDTWMYKIMTVAVQFLFWEYLFQIFGIRSFQWTAQLNEKKCSGQSFKLCTLCTTQYITNSAGFQLDRPSVTRPASTAGSTSPRGPLYPLYYSI